MNTSLQRVPFKWDDRLQHLWLATAFLAVSRLARHTEFICTDDIWEHHLVRLFHPRVPEPRSMAAVMAMARRAKLIVPTDYHKPSRLRERNHGRPVRVWRSLVFHNLG
jgi:hypothetical protein